MNKAILLLLLPVQLFAQPWSPREINRWSEEAKHVRISRDNWGIPHVFGKTDAACVFGLMYAQCEDDFKRIEMNYIEKLGRMAEIKGQSAIYDDLLIRMVIDSSDAVADYKRAPAWLTKLLNAFADGINFYLYKHPEDKPALLHRFQPWYPLLWTDGSIGAINTANISSTELKNFYTGRKEPTASLHEKEDPGFAIAGSRTASGNAILYINPHVSFYFRPEVHMISQEGLNAYGAVTWGQFFVYQGFNEHCGWMHTSSAADVADLYAEKISKNGNALSYEYDHAQKPVVKKNISIRYRSGDSLQTIWVPALFTRHGPIMAERNGQWLSVKASNRSMNGLIQCWMRTKARNFDEFKKTMELRTNTSNNTVYADAAGNIAYWHGNFIPVRDKKFDWSRPVDGTDPATEWKGLHTVNETVHIYNPANGWIQNCNSTPFTVSGAKSPKKEKYPPYMAPDGENFRAINAVRVLSREEHFTIDKVIAGGYDNYLAAFEELIPALIRAYDQTAQLQDSSYRELAEPIEMLRQWDFRSDANSVSTSLAVEWGQGLLPKIAASDDEYEYVDQVAHTKKFVQTAKARDLLEPMLATIHRLKKVFGDWRMAWGEINRYQRISDALDEQFDDRLPSYPVGRVSSAWGCLPSFASRYLPGTKKRYGLFGNSFICAVEFGKRVKAKSLLTGGESGHSGNKHFDDQAEMYAEGKFKEVLFYKEDIIKHTERTYHPGE